MSDEWRLRSSLITLCFLAEIRFEIELAQLLLDRRDRDLAERLGYCVGEDIGEEFAGAVEQLADVVGGEGLAELRAQGPRHVFRAHIRVHRPEMQDREEVGLAVVQGRPGPRQQ